jgi:hypothetical protein
LKVKKELGPNIVKESTVVNTFGFKVGDIIKSWRREFWRITGFANAPCNHPNVTVFAIECVITSHGKKGNRIKSEIYVTSSNKEEIELITPENFWKYEDKEIMEIKDKWFNIAKLLVEFKCENINSV